MSYNGKSEYSRIERIIRECVQKNAIPPTVSFLSLSEKDRAHIIKQVSNDCKKCVIGALYNDFEGKLYSFNLKGDGLFLGAKAHKFIAKYKVEIERLNYYAWARFLETINDDKALTRVLEKLDYATPKRVDLSMYQQILYNEFCENNCFYCGKKLKRSIHVDHFIPWSFMKTDNLWNFVLACPECNYKKSNSLTSEFYVRKIEARNKSIKLETNISPIIEKEFSNYYIGLIKKVWNYALMSGLRERNI